MLLRPTRACRSHEVGSFELLRQPLVVNYDEFEGMLLGIAFHMFENSKKLSLIHI